MPQIVPISLLMPTQKKLVPGVHRNINGPKNYISLLKDNTSPRNVLKNFVKAQNKGIYKAVSPNIFWHRIQNKSDVYSGLLCGLNSSCFLSERITTHENVLENRVTLFKNYLAQTRLQAEPLLVIHEDDQFALDFQKKVMDRLADHQYQLGNQQHQLWQLSTNQVAEFNQFAKRQSQFHLADGHHRLASSIRHLKTQDNPLPIQCFLINKKNSKRKSFQWNIKQLPNQLRLYTQLEKVNSKSKKPDIIIATKDMIHRLTCPKKYNPAQYCFEELLGLSLDDKPNTKIYIDHIPLETKEYISIKKSENYVASIAFRPLHWSEILGIAKQGKRLPPKSTYLLPKLPTGLFISPI